MHIRRFVVLGVAAAVLATGPSLAVAQVKLGKEEQKRSKAQQTEVDQVFEVPLAYLMNPAHHRRHAFEAEGLRREWFVRYLVEIAA